MMAPPAALDVLRSPGQTLDPGLRAFMEPRFGHDFSQVRVHTDAAAALNARAYTAGSDVVFGRGEFNPQSHAGRVLVAHELAHVCQASAATPTLRRAVRIDGGKTRIRESDYQPGGRHADVGVRYKVAALIGDAVPRAFTNLKELWDFAGGRTDYIGDVSTKAAGTYWFRLPNDKLTVLGETHDSQKGLVEDVISGLRTKRFKYEGFTEMAEVAGQGTPGARAQVERNNQKFSKVAPTAQTGPYRHELEDATIKAVAGASQLRWFQPDTLDKVDKEMYGSRASISDYTLGERIALLLTLAIHISADLAAQGFSAPTPGEPAIAARARKLAAYYTANKAALDALMKKKDADPLLGILQLTEPNSFAVMPMLRGFVAILQEYGTAYTEQLGKERGNTELATEGKQLEANRVKGDFPISAAREATMWSEIEEAIAGGYLIVGMGDAHRRSLAGKLNARGIAHAFVEHALTQQLRDVAANWTK
jgi:hypothetical protein